MVYSQSFRTSKLNPNNRGMWTTRFIVILVLVSLKSCSTRNDTISMKDRQAEFPGGYEALQEFIHDYLDWKEPKDTIDDNLLVFLDIKANGEIGDIKLRYPLCPSCDSAVFRLVRRMPKWVPAQKDGENIESTSMISVAFRSSWIK